MKQRKHHRRQDEPKAITKAVTHIRLEAANAGKVAALDDLARIYLPLCQQYVNLFCTDEQPDKFRATCFATPLSERWHRVAIQQAAGIAQSWRSNRENAYQAYLEDLADYAEDQASGHPDPKRKEPFWKAWNTPILRSPCIQANVNVVVLEPSEDSTFDYWLRISTLDKGNPLRVPVKLAPYHKKALAGHTINTSTALHKRRGLWWLTLSFDEDVPQKAEPEAPCVGVDVGIASATRSRVHNRFIRLARRSEAYCSTSSTLERRSGKATSRCRSPLTTFLNHPLADRTVREHQCLLASERIGS